MSKVILILIAGFISMTASAHKGEHHPDPNHAKMIHPVGLAEKEKFAFIIDKRIM